MLYTQVLGFLIMMVVYEGYRAPAPVLSLTEMVLGSLAAAAVLWAVSGMLVSSLLRRASRGGYADPGRAARRLLALLQGLALADFFVIVIFLDFKAHMNQWGGLASSELFSGLVAVALYLALLLITWSRYHPVEVQVMGQAVERRAYVRGQARFAAPVVFPFLLLVAVRDLIYLIWPGGSGILESLGGDLIFLALFLVVTVLIFPPMVRSWWGCRPVPPGRVREVAEQVLDHLRIPVGGILYWPVMEGRLLTAGILGLAPRLRYLLITPALGEALSPLELAGVVAHEAGHVRHKHLAWYLALFMGLFVAAYAISEPLAVLLQGILYLVAGTDWGVQWLLGPEDFGGTASLIMALPLLAFLLVYLRYVGGYFMRSFERQADLFALKTLRDPEPLVGALEKIARLAGNIRDVPSWHHYSVAQRVEALRRASQRPEMIREQARGIRRAGGIYLVCLLLLLGMGLGLDRMGVAKDLNQSTVARLLDYQLQRHPSDPRLLMSRGVLLFELGREREALYDLEEAHRLVPDDPEVLNSLAWLLATAKDEHLRQPRRAVRLAGRAVRLKPAPHIWDTLAEAYFVFGRPDKAVAAARAALEAGPDQRREYFEDQLKRFEKALQDKL